MNDVDVVFVTSPRKINLGRFGQWSKSGYYVPFNSQGHIGTGPPYCHLFELNTQRLQTLINSLAGVSAMEIR